MVPVVAAVTSDGAITVLATRADLNRCYGSPERLVELLEWSAETQGLEWPRVSG